ncbi:hypothetical protein FDENT_4302 [Fusarium denticulatum]|uniref:Uncharacterized protein n=1 Tax=Fusarium denticulatum TaxID=48507 RepID=A0A8H5XBQ1_9HYPO|nr:hypothetical protein FDENT_4302 [Fusarium denticulatum]
MSSPTNCSWPDSLSDGVTASTEELNKDKPVPHLDYVPPIATVRVKPFSEPWPGDNPTRSRRTDLAESSAKSSSGEDYEGSPMIQAKDWTEAETDHLYYLIDEEYWRLWLEDVEPKPLWPWTHLEPVFFTFNESSRCFIHRPLQTPPRVRDSDSEPSKLPSRYDLTVKTNSGTHDAEPNLPATGRGLSRAMQWLANFALGL